MPGGLGSRYTLLALLLASCGGPHTCGSPGINLCGGLPPQNVPLTLRASVDGGQSTNVSSPFALNLPNIGDIGVVTAYEGSEQIPFSLIPSTGCTNVVTISPGTQAMQQAVTAVKNGGSCTAAAKAGNGNATLTIYALPPP